MGLFPIEGLGFKIILFLKEFFQINLPIGWVPKKKIKELHKQVDHLLSKGWMRKILNPCMVLVILVPKKAGI